MFKVVPDQLRISEGWVRCGHCAEIFDASRHLQSPEALAAEAAARQAAVQPPADAALPDTPSAPAVWQRRSVAARTVLHGEAPAVPPLDDLDEEQEDEPFGTYTAPGLDRLEFPPPRSSMPADAPAPPLLTTEDVPSALLLQTADSDEPQDLLYDHAFAAPAPAPGGSAEADIEAEVERQALAASSSSSSSSLLFPYEPEPQPEAGVRPALDAARGERRSASRRPLVAAERESLARGPDSILPAPGPDSIPPPDSVPAPLPPSAVPGTEVHAEALQDLGFVRAAERRAFWRRPAVALASLAACLLLVVALLLQVAVAQRDLVAAHLPGLRPTLEALCAPLHCQVSALRRIESIVIDGSAFNKARGDHYLLNVDLRSTAGVPLAMPSLELTLTDADDKTLLRRVLSPPDLRAPQVLAARGAWSGTLPVKLLAPVDATRVAGYRVLVFYP